MATLKRRTTLRLCTWNVHGWLAADGEDNFDAVAAVLADLKCDVIALQEVTSPWERAERMAKKLRMHETVAVAGYGSNVLLTRAKPTREWIIGSLVRYGSGEQRSAAAAEIDTPWGSTAVFATHLDHLSEDLRVEQWLALAGSTPEGARAIVLGDLNTHRLSDYAPGDLRWIEAARARARVGKMREDVMTEADQGGWVDLVRLGIAGSLAKYGRSLGDPIPYDSMMTSAYGTRVDYLMCSAAVASAVTVVSHAVIDDQDTGAPTDHRPVVVELARRTA